ncbi:phage virion morphogenesis protein [Cellvibrio sp. QJXJ]|uniref:phage virion morphogenesis protein n=1 Tax=Cellvibrio sp. QJXJ TaxID=2964606 RepID=UPI0021C41904|nr:phage virion morphogenesis protein [Cellvibrio sp. QJXJ]UUA73090.1 phage virion morphogenesis protein [Cellvibrio sp. QJXJ]
MSAIKFDVFGQLDVRKRLKLLTLPPAKRKRVMTQIGKRLHAETRRRLRTNKDVTGVPFAPRKEKRKGRMFRKLGNAAYYKSTDAYTEISFKGLAGVIAKEHQEGQRVVYTAAQAEKDYGTPDYDEPATRKQAKSLRDAGFKIKRGKKWQAPSLMWITKNLKLGQAGLILKALRDEVSKKRWIIELPERAFLGASPNDINQLVNIIFNETINAEA